MRKISAALLAALLLAPATAMAELRHVQLNVLGMDWVICAHTVRVALMKLPGVESAEVSLDKASADIRLKADNRISMTQLRQVLKKNGYQTRDAQIEARGRIVLTGGTLVLDLLNLSVMELDAKSIAATASTQIVDVSGISRADKATEQLTLLTTHR